MRCWQLTIDRIRNLAAVTGTEPLTVDFKEGSSTHEVAECAAAMPNAHGGLILIGITGNHREIAGVPRTRALGTSALDAHSTPQR